MTTADMLVLISIFLTAILGGLGLRFSIRADRRETAAAVTARLAEAEQRGRQEALRDARIADLEQQLNQRHQQGDGPL